MVAMTALAYGVASLGASIPLWAQYTENGLTSAAVGLVAIAAFKLGKKILQDRVDMLLALFACLMAINVTDQPMLFPLLMIFGASVSYIHWAWNERQQRLRKADEEETDEEAAPLLPESAASPSQLETIHISYNATTGLWVIGLFVILLIVATTLPLVVQEIHLNVLFTFYTIGSLIFGGGPVVIPLIQNFMLKLGWMASQEFLIGLAIINSLPGPMFNIAAFCGALALRNEGQAGLGAVLGYIGIFAPGLILKIGLIPLWQKYRGLVGVQRAFKGVNSSAVGLVFAAVYLLSIKCIVGRDHGASLTAYPIYVSIAATTFTLVEYLQVPAPILIIMGGVTGYSEYFIHSRA